MLIGVFLYALVFFSQFVLAALALFYMFSGVLARLLYLVAAEERTPAPRLNVIS